MGVKVVMAVTVAAAEAGPRVFVEVCCGAFVADGWIAVVQPASIRVMTAK